LALKGVRNKGPLIKSENIFFKKENPILEKKLPFFRKIKNVHLLKLLSPGAHLAQISFANINGTKTGGPICQIQERAH